MTYPIMQWCGLAGWVLYDECARDKPSNNSVGPTYQTNYPRDFLKKKFPIYLSIYLQ